VTDTKPLGWLELALIVFETYCRVQGWRGIEPFRDWWFERRYPAPASPESWGLLVERARAEGRIKQREMAV